MVTVQVALAHLAVQVRMKTSNKSSYEQLLVAICMRKLAVRCYRAALAEL